MIGGSSGDFLTGDANANTLAGGAGADTLTGLGGDDLYYVDDIGDVVIEALNGGYDTLVSTVSFTLSANVEAMHLIGAGLTGTGTGGNDALLSNGGPNTLVGLGGNDIYYVNHVGDVVTEALNGGYDTVVSSVSFTLSANVEAMHLIGAGLTGTGTGGNDALLSNGGPNTLVGLGGDDIYYVNHVGDVVTEALNGGYDTVVSSVSFTLSANVEAMHLIGAGLTGTGTGGNDALLSNGGPNTLVGLGGDDIYYVNHIGDVVTEALNGGYDTVVSSVSFTLSANVEAMHLIGAGLTGTGTGGNDALLSNGGPNTLVGLGGDDIYYVNHVGDVVTETLNGGYDTVVSSVSFTLSANVEVLHLLGTGLTGTGTGGNDSLLTLGANTLTGGGGDDMFWFVSGFADGAAVSDFDGLGEHDILFFSGFGTETQGATFTQIGDTDQWEIHSGLDAHTEVITLSNQAAPQAGDFFFL